MERGVFMTHTKPISYRWSILVGSILITACGGNQHGPTEFTYRENDLSRRHDSGRQLASQNEFEARARDSQNQAARHSANSSGFSADEALPPLPSSSQGFGGLSGLSSSPVNADTLAAVGIASLPLLLSGVMSGKLKPKSVSDIFGGLFSKKENPKNEPEEAPSESAQVAEAAPLDEQVIVIDLGSLLGDSPGRLAGASALEIGALPHDCLDKTGSQSGLDPLEDLSRILNTADRQGAILWKI